jgi:lipoprotein-anchoring transpeptidase ErfK/SrfK
MKRVLFALLLLGLALSSTPISVQAVEPGDVPLCLPPTFAIVRDDCLPYGPYGYLQHMAELGLTIPEQPLPASSPDTALASLPFYYARVTAKPGPIYASIEEAIVGKNPKRYIETGFDFVSYIERREVDGKKYYMIAPGEWMRGGDLAANVAYSQFIGLQFSATPVRKFGWTLQAIQSYQAPSTKAPLGERSFVRWDVIQVYDIQESEGSIWYLVGPDTWIESKDTALVYPTTTAPSGVDNGRWIEVNLLEQTLTVYNNNQMVYATLLSSGAPGFWTRPGLFHITQKLETTPMSGTFAADRSDYYYLEDVPWTMYFDGARALHGAYWHTKFGYVQSHGCVNLSPGDSKWLYDWAVMGDWVYVWDPSGKTPTDLPEGGGAF